MLDAARAAGAPRAHGAHRRHATRCRAQQQLTLLCADLVNEGFLRQSSFSKVDRYCSPARQVAMLRAAAALHRPRRGRRGSRACRPRGSRAMPMLRQLQRHRRGVRRGRPAQRFDATAARSSTTSSTQLARRWPADAR
ncbi:MAG: hypothetical protein MZV65_31405 [Chromatiales bacterium]|nr:hypothetical protein [Chromatiales bacterium]